MAQQQLCILRGDLVHAERQASRNGDERRGDLHDHGRLRGAMLMDWQHEAHAQADDTTERW